MTFANTVCVPTVELGAGWLVYLGYSHTGNAYYESKLGQGFAPVRWIAEIAFGRLPRRRCALSEKASLVVTLRGHGR